MLGYPAFWSLLGIALVLGVRHGLDADHLAAVDGLTRRGLRAGERRAPLFGVFFSLGHGGVVAVIALVAAALTAHRATPRWLDVSGALISIVFLTALGLVNLVAVLRTPADASVQPSGLRSRLIQRLSFGDHPLGVAVVGVFFAISFDTVSQGLLFAAAAPTLGGFFMVAATAACFVVGMVATDGLNGLFVAHLVTVADKTARMASRWLTAVIAVISLVIASLTLCAIVYPTMDDWLSRWGLWLSAAVLLSVVSAFTCGVLTRSAKAPAREVG